jgi:hypothetical protein
MCLTGFEQVLVDKGTKIRILNLMWTKCNPIFLEFIEEFETR